MSTKDPIVETRPVFDYDQSVAEAKKLLGEIEKLEERRLRLGRHFIGAKKQIAHGKWLQYLSDVGIEDRTARNYMSLAGYVDTVKSEKFSDIPGDVNVPTYAEAGVIKAAEPEEDERFGCADCGESFSTPVWHCPGCAHHWSDERSSCWNCHEFNSDGSRIAVDIDDAEEEKESRAISETFPSAQDRIPPMDERARRTHRLVQAITAAKSTLSACLKTENIHLTDVTTSPHEFEQVKGLIIELVNELLAELDRAGVLDGNEKRRQLKLLDGGLSK